MHIEVVIMSNFSIGTMWSVPASLMNHFYIDITYGTI